MTVPSFEFATAGRIVAGAGRAQELPGVLAGLGSRVLVVTGADPARHDELLASLGVAAAVFPVAAEPTVELARAAVAAGRAQGAEVIAAIGGGSVIDTGKAVAMLLGNGGDPLDYLEVVGSGRDITRPAVPCVAVPTTAGTGAEVTANAVLAVPSHQVKASLRSPFMLPRVALIDPLLTVSCPPAVTAASGLDALTQCLEPFVSVQATPLTDGLAREGLRRAGTGLRTAYADGSDIAARADMAMCSLLGGMALANAKLGAVHGLAGVIGGTADVPHGMACAALLAPVIEANVRVLRSGGAGPAGVLDRYTEAARLLTGRPGASLGDGLAWIRETLALLHVPGLATFGVGPQQADEIAAKALVSSSMKGNPVPLSRTDLEAVVLQALLPWVMARPVPRHDRDAGGPPEVLAAKAALRHEVWSAMRTAKVARFPGAAGRIPNFAGAEAAAERLRATAVWQAAGTLKANPDSAQLPVRQRALEDGKTVYMAVPRLAGPEPFFALDPDHLSEPPRKAASISGASRSARRVALAGLAPVDLVVMGSVAAGEDGARLGKGGGFADLEFALAAAAGLIGPDTTCVTTVHELQVMPAGVIPLTSHDVPVDFIVTPDRMIDCRPRHGPRPVIGIRWEDLTEEKIAAIPLLAAQRPGPSPATR